MDNLSRQSIRLKSVNYTEQGAYFVTLCTDDRRRLFGEIIGGTMVPNSLGWIVDDEWRRIGAMRDGVALDEFTLMPDHFHGIIVFKRDFEPIHRSSYYGGTQRKPFSLGSVLAGFKAAVTSRARLVTEDSEESIWQRNYYERIIRDEREMEAVRHYIRANPENWRDDRQNELV